MKKIVIIEDNIIIANNTAEFLRMEGYVVDVFHAGDKGFEEIQYQANMSTPYDLAILDRMLPGLDGLSIGRLIKNKKIPTAYIFLTAKDKQTDVIEGLEIEADDYLIKPFDLDELVLRIKNILKRGKKSGADGLLEGKVQIGDITLDTDSHQVHNGDEEIILSPKEYAIFEYLASNQGKIVSRENLFENVWNDYGSSFAQASDTINVHIAYLRRKLGKDAIRTVK